MRALQIHHHAPIAELEVREIADPTPGPHDALVRVEAAGVNPSDVASALGRFPGSPLPRVLGRDFAGADGDGLPVWGTGGDLGIARDGTHAERLLIPSAALVERPANLSAEQAAVCGVAFVTAWLALDLVRLDRGESVLIAGAAGAVGRAAAQLARARGAAAVLALVRRDADRGAVDPAFTAAASVEGGDLADVVARATGGRGCQAALNGVGASLHPALVEALADGGRLAVYSAAGGRDATVDLFAFYRRRLTLRGLNTVAADVVQCGRILASLKPLFEDGSLRPPEIAARYPLAEAPAAYQRVANGAPGKLVLLP